MNFIISVLKDFYECCNMPVKAISSEFDDIYKIGYNDYSGGIPLRQAVKTNIWQSCDFISRNYLRANHAVKVIKYTIC